MGELVRLGLGALFLWGVGSIVVELWGSIHVRPRRAGFSTLVGGAAAFAVTITTIASGLRAAWRMTLGTDLGLGGALTIAFWLAAPLADYVSRVRRRSERLAALEEELARLHRGGPPQ